MFGSLDISTSGMIAQRVRLDTISANLANSNTLLDENGEVNPYRRREVFLAPGRVDGKNVFADGDTQSMGVRVRSIGLDERQVTPRTYDPSSPFAFKEGPFKGYVAETGVNTVMENINAVEAVRAYEANVMAAEASKQMMASALRLLA
jgi:flagellar basal-body rod protein FlgC